MIWLIIILGYILPIVIFYILAYINTKPGQTISYYLESHYLDDLSIMLWIPIFNIAFLIGWSISKLIISIENIKKP